MSFNRQLQKAFVLHYRPYRETSLLVDFLTEESGRVCVVARGVKRPKSQMKGLLQPFTSLTISFRAKNELGTLISVENCGIPTRLSGDALLSGFYLNELLMRVLHRDDACEKIFSSYEKTIYELNSSKNIQLILRKFEKNLLCELGYGLPLTLDSESGLKINPDEYYYFISGKGFTSKQSTFQGDLSFLGGYLLDFAADIYHEGEMMSSIKKLMRSAFKPLLGGKPLKSRELYIRKQGKGLSSKD